MKRVDLNALRKAAGGDQSKKVSVTKEWLKLVHDELVELRQRRHEEQLTAQQERDLDRGLDETFGHMDQAFSSMDKMFKKVFGKNSSSFVSRKIASQRSKT